MGSGSSEQLRESRHRGATRSISQCAAFALTAFVLVPPPARTAPIPDAPHAAPAAARTERPGSWRVLLLFDEARDSPANVQFEETVRVELARDAGRRLEFYSEYLDSSRMQDEDYKVHFFEFLGEKYRSRPLDVVVAFAISSAEALAAPVREALPHVPIAAAVVDPLSEKSIPAVPGITGVIGRADPGAMLTLVHRVRPGARKFFLLEGDARLDRDLTEATLAAAARWGGLPPIERLRGLSYDQIRDAVGRLPADSALLTTTYLRDASGESFRGAQVAAELSQIAPVPLFVLFDPAIGGGAVGGVVMSVEVLARRTAAIALRLLRGAAPESIAVEIYQGREPIFDARALTRWEIPETLLPPQSDIRFRPLPFWRQYPLGSTALAVTLVVQTALISALLFERRRARRAEASLQAQAMQLGHLSRISLLGTISASLAHELNQPLAAILANTQAGIRFLNRPEPDLAELRAILEDNARDVKRAGGVITSLRNMLRHHEQEVERVDLGDLARDTVALLRSELVERRVDVAVRAAAGSRAPVDRGQIQQVILNLLLNAAEAVADLPEGARRVEVRVHPTPSGDLRVVVADSGPGVPPERVESIFDSFWTTKRHGMGMGLAICRTIVDRHGGRIWAENGSPAGARFCFELPLEAGKPVVGGEARGSREEGTA